LNIQTSINELTERTQAMVHQDGKQISLKRKNKTFGFSLRKVEIKDNENNVIKSFEILENVKPQANKKGLENGLQVVQVNGKSIKELGHEKIISIIKNEKKSINLLIQKLSKDDKMQISKYKEAIISRSGSMMSKTTIQSESKTSISDEIQFPRSTPKTLNLVSATSLFKKLELKLNGEKLGFSIDKIDGKFILSNIIKNSIADIGGVLENDELKYVGDFSVGTEMTKTTVATEIKNTKNTLILFVDRVIVTESIKTEHETPMNLSESSVKSVVDKFENSKSSDAQVKVQVNSESNDEIIEKTEEPTHAKVDNVIPKITFNDKEEDSAILKNTVEVVDLEEGKNPTIQDKENEQTKTITTNIIQNAIQTIEKMDQIENQTTFESNEKSISEEKSLEIEKVETRLEILLEQSNEKSASSEEIIDVPRKDTASELKELSSIQATHELKQEFKDSSSDESNEVSAAEVSHSGSVEITYRVNPNLKSTEESNETSKSESNHSSNDQSKTSTVEYSKRKVVLFRNNLQKKNPNYKNPKSVLWLQREIFH